jgi:hypothetical protein
MLEALCTILVYLEALGAFFLYIIHRLIKKKKRVLTTKLFGSINHIQLLTRHQEKKKLPTKHSEATRRAYIHTYRYDRHDDH